MLEEYKERIQNAKDKRYKLLDRFHIGDTVYPFYLKNVIVYGTVIDIDTVARKIICDFNGMRRQFCPEDLMLLNPGLDNRNIKKASFKKTVNKVACSYLFTDLPKDEKDTADNPEFQKVFKEVLKHLNKDYYNHD